MGKRYVRTAIVFAIMPVLVVLLSIQNVAPIAKSQNVLAQAAPTLELNDVEASVTVYLNQAVSYGYDYQIAEIAIWSRADCSGTPNYLPYTGSNNMFQFVSSGTARTLWTRARLLNNSSATSPCYSMTWIARPTATATPTHTAIPTATATSTATETATSTVTETATSTATETATSTETEPATSTPTETPTNAPTVTSTVQAPNTPTIVPTSEATTSQTEVPPTSGPTTGSAAIVVVTSDGSPLPDETTVCLGDQCQNLDDVATGEVAAAAAPSGSVATFDGIAPGTYPVTVSVGSVQLFAGSIDIISGATSNLTVTVNAVAPGTPDPGGETTVTPVVSELPSTGSGDSSLFGTYLVLLIAAGLVAIGGLLTLQQRRR